MQLLLKSCLPCLTPSVIKSNTQSTAAPTATTLLNLPLDALSSNAQMPPSTLVLLMRTCKELRNSLQPLINRKIASGLCAQNTPDDTIADIRKYINHINTINGQQPEQTQESARQKLNDLAKKIQKILGNTDSLHEAFTHNVGTMLAQSLPPVDPEIASSGNKNSQAFHEQAINEFAKQLTFALSCTNNDALKQQILNKASTVLRAGLSLSNRIKITRASETSPTMLDVLSRDEDWDIRAKTANHQETPTYRLTVLSGDKAHSVRAAAARNINNAPETLALLTQDEEWIVRLAAVKNKSTPIDAVQQRINSDVEANESVRDAAQAALAIRAAEHV